MQTTLSITRYKPWAIPFAFLSMAIFRLPLSLNKSISFFKLMGTGKNGTFDKMPDFHQWAILCVHKSELMLNDTTTILESIYGKFISTWLTFFATETYTLLLEPITGHGLWDKKEVFGKIENNNIHTWQVATLTRATIRLSTLKHFWKNVAPVANKMTTAKGYIFSVGIGETPWIKQATFSVWDSVEDMKTFAYSMKEHSDVIKKTRKEKWYSEDMFVRFKIIETFGKIHGINPLERKL